MADTKNYNHVSEEDHIQENSLRDGRQHEMEKNGDVISIDASVARGDVISFGTKQ